MNAIAMEYPGYGVYKGKANEKTIYEDSLIVYDHLIKELKIDPTQIYILGRSIGTGAAIYLASKRKCNVLILIAAFASIRHLAEHWIGKIAAKLLIK